MVLLYKNVSLIYIIVQCMLSNPPGSTPGWLFRCLVFFPLVMLPYQHAMTMDVSKGDKAGGVMERVFFLGQKMVGIIPSINRFTHSQSHGFNLTAREPGNAVFQYVKKRKRKWDMNIWYCLGQRHYSRRKSEKVAFFTLFISFCNVPLTLLLQWER